MVMHCGMKRKLSCLTDGNHPPPTIPDRDHYHQQALLNISVHKLQDEQAKHGIESRLLRFVLINNAIRALQGHILSAEDNSANDSFTLFQNFSSSDVFLSNTLSHGALSYPPSPPTPAKIAKFESDHSVSDSPLASSCSYPSLGCSENGSHNGEVSCSASDDLRQKGPPTSPPSPASCCNGSISGFGPLSNEIDDIANECRKKRPRTLTITIDDQLPPLQPAPFDDCDHFLPSPTTPTSSDHSSSLSPIDFAKVDVSLYDFDAHTNLVFPPVQPTEVLPHSHAHTSSPSRLSCSLQAQNLSGNSHKLEHIYDVQQHEEEAEDIDEEDGTQVGDEHGDYTDPSDSSGTISNIEGDPGPASSTNTSITASSSSSSPVESLSPDGFDNFDDPHEIDRIVSLLMA